MHVQYYLLQNFMVSLLYQVVIFSFFFCNIIEHPLATLWGKANKTKQSPEGISKMIGKKKTKVLSVRLSYQIVGITFCNGTIAPVGARFVSRL